MAQSSEIEKLERRWADNPLGLTFAPLAEAYRRAGDQPRALEVLEVGLGRHPAYVPALIVRARCHLDAGLNAAAEEAFREVLVSDAHNLIALKGLADICERADRLEEARAHLDRLLEADPTHDEARAQHARVSLVVEARQVAVAQVPDAGPPAQAPERLLEASVGSDPDWVPAEFTITASDDTPLWATEDVAPAPADAALSAESIETAAVTAPVPAEAPLSQSAEHDLVINRETSPFEGFDPTSWDLPFGDTAATDQPFEESEPLAPVTLEQTHEVSVQSSPASALDEVVPDWSGAEDTPAEAPDDATNTQRDELETELPEGPAVVEPVVESMEQGSSPLEEIEVVPVTGFIGSVAEPTVSEVEALPLLHPMDIPDFVSWDPAVPATDEPRIEIVPEQELDAGPERPGQDLAPPAPPAGDDLAAGLTEVVPDAPRSEAAGLADSTGLEAPAVPAVESEPWPRSADLAPSIAAEDQPVVLVDGALDESPVDPLPEPASVEPELVITETMAEVFLRQGHKPLALAVYAQLLERDAGNARLLGAVTQLRAELLPGGAAAPVGSTGGPTTEEPVGAFLARVLGPGQATTGGEAIAVEEQPPGGRPTHPSAEPSLELSSIFGEEDSRARRTSRPAAENRSEGEPTFDEFFGAPGGAAGVVAGVAGDQQDLEQFNAWLRSLSR